MNSTECILSNTRKWIVDISSLLESSFGLGGKAILFERSGSVFTTRDGAEILSILQLSHPMVEIVANSAISFASEYGDGSKLLLIVMKCLFLSLDKSIDDMNETIRRRKMLQTLNYISEVILPKLHDTVEYDSFFHITENNIYKLSGIIFPILFTKFSRKISKILTTLLCNYVTESTKNKTTREFLKEVIREPSLFIVQIAELPITQSHIADGFIITRDFKYRNFNDSLTNCSFILWSCPLEFTPDEMTGKVAVENAAAVLDTYFFQAQQLTNTLSILKAKGISLIISSIFFPDWAKSICMEYGISLVDMVRREEFEYVSKILDLSDLTFMESGKHIPNVGHASFQRFLKGDSKFIQISLPSKQLVITAPTLSHCRQYSKALTKTLIYLHKWIEDSESYYASLEQKMEPSGNVIGYCGPCGHTNFLQIYNKLQSETGRGNLELATIVMTETLKQVLYIYYQQLSYRKVGTFLVFLSSSPEPLVTSNPSLQERLEPAMESPFLALKIMEIATHTLMQVIKINQIMRCRKSLKDVLNKSPKADDEDSGDE